MPQIIQYLIDAIQYKEYLVEHYFTDHEARWSNIGELISVARKTPNADDGNAEGNSISGEDLGTDQLQSTVSSDGVGESESDSVVEFLEYCALCSNQKELDEAEGGVNSF